jgi:hypothetical protein
MRFFQFQWKLNEGLNCQVLIHLYPIPIRKTLLHSEEQLFTMSLVVLHSYLCHYSSTIRNAIQLGPP